MFFPLMNQSEVLDHYPWLVPRLYLAVTGEVIMTLTRLFETKKDQRKASLVTFLGHVQELPLDGMGEVKEPKQQYREKIPSFLTRHRSR
jgi:hypothetical protein